MNSLIILSSLIEPAVGLIFWTSITFILLLVILGKFAWKPILNAIKTREKGIESALATAENALKDVRELKANNERILHEARAERDNLLKEAREMKDAMIAEAKTKANEKLGCCFVRTLNCHLTALCSAISCLFFIYPCAAVVCA